ncbi:Uncharacterised protein [Vibrio cholerae]|nr:Uncharacterised protein [Vibrio cholerae]CSI70467.1 Uncharacterised protein [Vibrio cholerae]
MHEIGDHFIFEGGEANRLPLPHYFGSARI